MNPNYQIISLLGSGGFANVFLAERRDTGERVAIKVLHRAGQQERFAREAAALGALTSPNTVRLLEYGRSVSGLFMVFEFVGGAEELEAFLAANGPLPWPEAVGLLRQILNSLAEAHGLGIVHRDIKPANMLITPEGQIKVLDFGLVRLLPDIHDVTPLTMTGTVMGTPRYMAPEVLRAAQAAGPVADIFAVGLIAYQLLVGQQANVGRSTYEVIARHLDPEPYELPEHVDVPYAIRIWVDAMMRKDWQRRVPDAKTALAELETHLAETRYRSEQLPAVVRAAPEVTIAEAVRPVSHVGEFDLTEKLGNGATATVWAAHHRGSGGAAAVKFLLAGAADELREAFFVEARAHAGLEHPNIVRLLDYGHVVDDDSAPENTAVGDPYLVMELAEGTLRDKGLPSTWTQTFDLLMQVLDGLAFAHARGVIHRDLKPENVLCFEDGTYKLADFGIAHSLRSTTSSRAQTLAESIGTPRYMSPEQFRGHAYDYGPATDLYALGCVAYELVVGRVPFGGPRLIDIARQHAAEPMPTPIPRFEVPPGLAGWLARLLGKRPEERFEAAADASWQLQELAGGFRASGESAEHSDFSGPADPTFVAPSGATLLDPGSLLTVLETEWETDEMDGLDAETRRVGIEPSPITPPPIPHSWRRPPDRAQSLEGLGLFALRELPLAGQDHARDVLWHALLRARSEGSLIPVVLRGGPRSPISQLGHWFAARAAEVGGAHAVFLSHTATGAPREGIVGAIEDLFGTWSLADEDAADLIRRKINDDMMLAAEVAATDAEILAQELMRARGGRPSSSSSEHERFAAVARVLRRRAHRRPLVLFVDHLQYSPETAAFVRYLLDQEADLPAVVAIGKRAAASRASLERDLEALVSDPRCQALDVSAYTEAEFSDFAQRLLPMRDGLVSLLSEVTSSDPAATQLAVADLIDRGLLVQNGDVFATSRDLVPGEMSRSAVIERRLDRLGLDADDRRALSVCAVLSEAPDVSEVAAVCRKLGLNSPERLGASLEEVGLARSSGAGWWFSPGVVPHLLGGVSDPERREIGRECGHVIVGRTAPDDVDSWTRAARYYVEAGAAYDALEPLYRAVRLLVTRDLETAEMLIAERGTLLALLGTTPESTVWIDQLNLLSIAAKTRGDRKAAMKHITAAHDLATSEGYSRGLARALRDSAAVAVDLGSLGEAAARFDRAALISAESGDLLDEAHAWFGGGFVEYRRGDLDAAERHYHAAIARFEAVGAQQARARAMSYLSAVYVAAGRMQEARDAATEAQNIARACGALAIVAETKSDLAEIARFMGDYDVARQLYGETARWQQLAGSRSDGAITTLNLALVDLGAGNYTDANRTLEGLEQDVIDLGLVARLALIRIARLVAAVGSGREAVAEELLEKSREMLATTEPDRDIAWAYECGVHAAQGNESRQRWFRKRAVAEYGRLGDSGRASQISSNQ